MEMALSTTRPAGFIHLSKAKKTRAHPWITWSRCSKRSKKGRLAPTKWLKDSIVGWCKLIKRLWLVEMNARQMKLAGQVFVDYTQATLRLQSRTLKISMTQLSCPESSIGQQEWLQLHHQAIENLSSWIQVIQSSSLIIIIKCLSIPAKRLLPSFTRKSRKHCLNSIHKQHKRQDARVTHSYKSSQ